MRAPTVPAVTIGAAGRAAQAGSFLDLGARAAGDPEEHEREGQYGDGNLLRHGESFARSAGLSSRRNTDAHGAGKPRAIAPRARAPRGFALFGRVYVSLMCIHVDRKWGTIWIVNVDPL